MGTFQPREFAAPSGAARALVDAVPLATLVIGDLSAVQLPLLCPDPPGVDPTVMLGHVAAAGPFADVTSTDAPAAYIARQRRNILAVRLNVHEIVVTHKLSQNRSAEDVAGVVAGLRADGGRAAEDVADAVERASFPR
jgi:predicted FMN-binding regulatory protein PaiB